MYPPEMAESSRRTSPTLAPLPQFLPSNSSDPPPPPRPTITIPPMIKVPSLSPTPPVPAPETVPLARASSPVQPLRLTRSRESGARKQQVVERPPVQPSRSHLDSETEAEPEEGPVKRVCRRCRYARLPPISSNAPADNTDICTRCQARQDAQNRYDSRRLAARPGIPDPPASLFTQPSKSTDHGAPPDSAASAMDVDDPLNPQQIQPVPPSFDDMPFHANIPPGNFSPDGMFSALLSCLSSCSFYATAMMVDDPDDNSTTTIRETSPTPPPVILPGPSPPPAMPRRNLRRPVRYESEDENLAPNESKPCTHCSAPHRARYVTCSACRARGREYGAKRRQAGPGEDPVEGRSSTSSPVPGGDSSVKEEIDDPSLAAGETKPCKQCKKPHRTTYQTCSACRERGRQAWHKRQIRAQADAVAREVAELVGARRTIGMLAPAQFGDDLVEEEEVVVETRLKGRPKTKKELEETPSFPALAGDDAMQPPAMTDVRSCALHRPTSPPIPIPPRDDAAPRRTRKAAVVTVPAADSVSASVSAPNPSTKRTSSSRTGNVFPRKKKALPLDESFENAKVCGRCGDKTVVGNFVNCAKCRKVHVSRYRKKKGRDDESEPSSDDFEEDWPEPEPSQPIVPPIADPGPSSSAGPATADPAVPALDSIPVDGAPAVPAKPAKKKKCNLCHKAVLPAVTQFKSCEPCREKRRVSYRQRVDKRKPIYQSASAPLQLKAEPQEDDLMPQLTVPVTSSEDRICSGCRKVTLPPSEKFKTCATCRSKHRLLPDPTAPATLTLDDIADPPLSRTRSSKRNVPSPKSMSTAGKKRKANAVDEDEIQEVPRPQGSSSPTKLFIRLPARKPQVKVEESEKVLILDAARYNKV